MGKDGQWKEEYWETDEWVRTGRRNRGRPMKGYGWATHSPVSPYSYFYCPSVPLHRSTSTHPSTARTYPFTRFPLLLLPLPVLTILLVSPYSCFYCPSVPLHRSPLLLFPLPIRTPSPVYLYSSFHCLSVPFHRSPSTPPSTPCTYPFTGLPLLLLPLPVHTPSLVSLYSSFHCPSSPLHRSPSTLPSNTCPSVPLNRFLFSPPSTAQPHPFTGLPLLLLPLPVRTPSPVSLYPSFHCPSVPLHRSPSTPPSTSPVCLHIPRPPLMSPKSPHTWHFKIVHNVISKVVSSSHVHDRPPPTLPATSNVSGLPSRRRLSHTQVMS
jgi:hypothetical protein